MIKSDGEIDGMPWAQPGMNTDYTLKDFVSYETSYPQYEFWFRQFRSNK